MEGMACRHGQIADPNQASQLIGDCNVVANFALGSGSLREQEDANRAIVTNSIMRSPTYSTVLHFSTVAVYGNPYQNAPMRWKSSYARSKLRTEGLALRLARDTRKRVFVLRLGHVAGMFQPISRAIRSELSLGRVRLPSPDRKSNIVYTATIAEAILMAAEGMIGQPGTYDLFNVPQWTWMQVYCYEAAALGVSVEIESAGRGSERARSSIRTILARMAGILPRSRFVKEHAMQLIARFSPAVNEQLQAIYYSERAAREISALAPKVQGGDAARWRELGGHPLTGLRETAALLRDHEIWTPLNGDALKHPATESKMTHTASIRK